MLSQHALADENGTLSKITEVGNKWSRSPPLVHGK